MLFFCYGTLKKGERNERMLSEQKFIGPAKTLPKYKLYNLGGYPGLKPCEDGMVVHGELYDIDEKCVERLDRYEGHPSLFKRDEIQIEGAAGKVVAYFYQHGVDKRNCVESWKESMCDD